MRSLLCFERCFTGRRWINIGLGLFAVGFGPRHFIERVYFNHRLVYARLYNRV